MSSLSDMVANIARKGENASILSFSHNIFSSCLFQGR